MQPSFYQTNTMRLPLSTLPALLLLCLCFAPPSFAGPPNATALLRRLYDAAAERASATRGSNSAVDVIARAIDYARDQAEKPPMRSVELNLLALRSGILLLSDELRRAKLELDGSATCRVCDLIEKTTQLVPVQGSKYTEIVDEE